MREDVRVLSGRARAHQFDLLGSTLVEPLHGALCAGVEGNRYEMGEPVRPDPEGRWIEGRLTAANLRHARRVWALVDPGYVPIDWQLDFKSGYRWSESTWYRDIVVRQIPGVDIKVPWELARMQHLPQLAWAFALARRGESGFAVPDAYVREMRNQILDFIATNPPRFGVNWVCTMDVAIRIANWLVAHDLFRALGATFDPEFEKAFAASAYDHGRHIAANLEWYASDGRGNHYLSDVVGLLFAAAYLPSSPETDGWLALSLGEVFAEAERQFGADGASFEGSTCYHRLAAELVVYAIALASSLEPDRLRVAAAADPSTWPPRIDTSGPAPRLPVLPIRDGALVVADAQLERFARMAEFTLDCTRPDGRVIQVGDNDSGRFLKLVARAEEDPLDHRHLVAALNGFLGRADLRAAAGPFAWESELVSGLARRTTPAAAARIPAAASVRFGTIEDWRPTGNRIDLRFASRAVSLRADLELRGYPDFGLWFFRSPALYLAIRCGPMGQNGQSSHAHNDQLAIELVIDGEDRIRDPGSYLYTPLPARRNEYRSVAAHFAPRVAGREPGRLNLGLFRLGDDAKAQALYFGPDGFVGKHSGYGADVFRKIEVLDDAIVITDWSSLELVESYSPPPFSPGYGLRVGEGR